MSRLSAMIRLGRRMNLMWERDGVAFRRWTALIGAATGVAAVVGTMAWSAAPIDVAGVLTVLAVAVGVSATVSVPGLTDLWDRAGFVVSAILIALLVRSTGGVDSNYQDLFLMIPVTSALTLSLRGFSLASLVTVLGALAPVLYQPDAVTADYLANLAADAGVWLGATVVIYAQVQRRREQQAELRGANEIKSTFLQATSHELRTPLTVIQGLSELLEKRIDEIPVEQRDLLLSRLTSNAIRLRELLDDLLDVDKLLRGAVSVDRRQTDLAELVTRVLDQMEDHGRPMTVALEPVTEAVDPAKMERVVENLVANAVRHTPDGTPIEIRLERRAAEVLFTVEDRGPGVPQALRQAIFDPFVQGAVAGSSPKPGTGIGLALVARLVELHEGRVWVEDGAAGGSRFSVALASRSAAVRPAVSPGGREPVSR